MSEQITRSDIASIVLRVLRHFRDNEPEAWDRLISTKSGVLMLELWDAMKTVEKTA